MTRNKQPYPLINIGDDRYEVVAQYPIDSIKETDYIKEWLQCEKAFSNKKDNTIYFCNLIQEVKIIEEILIETAKIVKEPPVIQTPKPE